MRLLAALGRAVWWVLVVIGVLTVVVTLLGFVY